MGRSGGRELHSPIERMMQSCETMREYQQAFASKLNGPVRMRRSPRASPTARPYKLASRLCLVLEKKPRRCAISIWKLVQSGRIPPDICARRRVIRKGLRKNGEAYLKAFRRVPIRRRE